MKVVINLLLPIFFHWNLSILNAQAYIYNDAKSDALAYTSLTSNNSWSIYNNPALLSVLEDPELAIGYRIPYQLHELSIRSVCAGMNSKYGSFGGAYSKFGTTVYSVNSGAISYANKLADKIHGGITLNIHSINLPGGFQPARTLSGDIGLVIYPSPRLVIGLCAKNISGSTFNTYSFAPVERLYSTGISYYERNYSIGALLRLSDQHSAVVGIGTELKIMKNLTLMLGATVRDIPELNFGVGFLKERWSSDLSFSRHKYLGYTSNISLSFFLLAK